MIDHLSSRRESGDGVSVSVHRLEDQSIVIVSSRKPSSPSDVILRW